MEYRTKRQLYLEGIIPFSAKGKEGAKTTKRDKKTVLPLPPENVEQKFEMEIYAHFMRYLRYQTHRLQDLRIYSAIFYTSGALRIDEDLVSKTLVDLGLRASRDAFPESYLNFCDHIRRRLPTEFQMSPKSVQNLQRHWASLGDLDNSHSCSQKSCIDTECLETV